MNKKEIVWHRVDDGDLPNYPLIHYVQDNFGEHCYYDISRKVWRTVNDEIRHIPEYWCEIPRLDAKLEMMTPQEHLEESVVYALKGVDKQIYDKGFADGYKSAVDKLKCCTNCKYVDEDLYSRKICKIDKGSPYTIKACRNFSRWELKE